MRDEASRFRVALTFDAEHPDRPTEPGVTAAILDRLAELAVPATFFVQGRWVEAEPAVAKRKSGTMGTSWAAIRITMHA